MKKVAIRNIALVAWIAVLGVAASATHAADYIVGWPINQDFPLVSHWTTDPAPPPDWLNSPPTPTPHQQVLTITGPIDTFDTVKVKQALRRLDGSKSHLTVVISSPGGELYEGYRVAEQLMAWAEETDTELLTIAAGPGAWSAGAILWMAGDSWGIIQNSMVGFHGPYHPNTRELAAEELATFNEYVKSRWQAVVPKTNPLHDLGEDIAAYTRRVAALQGVDAFITLEGKWPESRSFFGPRSNARVDVDMKTGDEVIEFVNSGRWLTSLELSSGNLIASSYLFGDFYEQDPYEGKPIQLSQNVIFGRGALLSDDFGTKKIGEGFWQVQPVPLRPELMIWTEAWKFFTGKSYARFRKERKAWFAARQGFVASHIRFPNYNVVSEEDRFLTMQMWQAFRASKTGWKIGKDGYFPSYMDYPLSVPAWFHIGSQLSPTSMMRDDPRLHE